MFKDKIVPMKYIDTLYNGRCVLFSGPRAAIYSMQDYVTFLAHNVTDPIEIYLLQPGD